jgi:hypothetical protein
VFIHGRLSAAPYYQLKCFIEENICNTIGILFRKRGSPACDKVGVAEVAHEAVKIAGQNRIDPHEKMAESEQIGAEDSGEFNAVTSYKTIKLYEAVHCIHN